MRGAKRFSLFDGVTDSPTLLVVLKVGLDLMFKFLCYFVVFKFYVYVKPRFCRKPVLPKTTTGSGSGNEDQDDEENEKGRVQGDDATTMINTENKIPSGAASTRKSDPDFSDTLDDTDFVKATEDLLARIKARKAYTGSQKIEDLHTRLRRQS